MECLKFKLWGKTACFRRAEFNTYAYFTYNNIHKPALLGLLGAILGYGGYNQQKEEDKYPEYYAKLKNLKVSIVPVSKNHGVFAKKIQTFNNSVGYASDEEGGNLVVREQWLENPCWYIYIQNDDSDEYNRLKDFISKGKAVYIPYLGKNDHQAIISDVEIVCVEKSDSVYVDSIVVDDNVEYEEITDDVDYLVCENVPCAMDPIYNFAIYSKSVYTNYKYKNLNNVYSDGNLNLYFY